MNVIEQFQQFFDQSGRTVCFIGGGQGSGKSTLIRMLKQRLPNNVMVASPDDHNKKMMNKYPNLTPRESTQISLSLNKQRKFRLNMLQLNQLLQAKRPLLHETLPFQRPIELLEFAKHNGRENVGFVWLMTDNPLVNRARYQQTCNLSELDAVYDMYFRWCHLLGERHFSKAFQHPTVDWAVAIDNTREYPESMSIIEAKQLGKTVYRQEPFPEWARNRLYPSPERIATLDQAIADPEFDNPYCRRYEPPVDVTRFLKPRIGDRNVLGQRGRENRER